MIWLSCIARGADLACWTCRREVGHLRNEKECAEYIAQRLVCCDDCCKIKFATDFSEDMREKWSIRSVTEHISCKVCTGEESAKGRHAVDKTQLYPCAGEGCSKRQLAWPQSHFIAEDLRHATWRGVNARCAKCIVAANAKDSDVFTCNACERVKHILDYSPIYCRQFLQDERRAHIWRCMACQFPKCKLCDARPESPVMLNHVEADGSWYCLLHRYPPCCVCRVTPRPASAMVSKKKFKDWTCDGCRDVDKEGQSSAKPSDAGTGAHAVESGARTSSSAAGTSPTDLGALHPCKECQQPLRSEDFRKYKNRHVSRTGRCKACEFPACASCGLTQELSLIHI